MSLIQMSQVYKERPSSILGIEDTYTSFCLDEACAFIAAMLRDGKVPKFTEKESSKATDMKARLPSDIYRHYEAR